MCSRGRAGAGAAPPALAAPPGARGRVLAAPGPAWGAPCSSVCRGCTDSAGQGLFSTEALDVP